MSSSERKTINLVRRFDRQAFRFFKQDCKFKCTAQLFDEIVPDALSTYKWLLDIKAWSYRRLLRPIFTLQSLDEWALWFVT